MRWEFDGVALDDLGIVTQVSDAFKLPERRGENLVIPFRHGRTHVEKFYDQRNLTLGLEISESSLADLEARIDEVKGLVGARGLHTLTQVLEDFSERTLQVEHVGDFGLARISPTTARMTLEFVAPDPFFRGGDLVSDVQVINASPKTYTLNNPGTFEECDPKIILTGPLSTPQIENLSNGVSLIYMTSIPSPRVVTIQTDPYTGEYTAVDDLGTNVLGNVAHFGSAALMVLQAGNNSMQVIDGTHTTGTVTIEFYPPYL